MKTIIDTINNKEIIKEEQANNIVSLYIKKKELEKYLKNDIQYNDDKTCYSRADRIITFNESYTFKLANQLYNYLNNYFGINDNSYSYYINFYYLYRIYHELTHSYQYKRDEIGYKHSYSYLHLINNRLITKNNDYYEDVDGHDFFPMEIEADNIGFSMAYKIMKMTDISKRDLKVLYTYYLSTFLYNYSIESSEKRIISPIEKLSFVTKGIDMIKLIEIIKQDNLNLLERVKFGLPITFLEYFLLYQKQKNSEELIKKYSIK